MITRYTSNFKNLNKIINKIKFNKQIPIIDYANENTSNYKKNFDIINNIISTYPNNTFALKFSSLGLSQTKDINSLHLSNIIIKNAKQNNSTILIDAEQNDIQNTINVWTDNLILKHNHDRPLIYKTYQMYRKDSFELFCKDLDRFKGIFLGIKLVRGAYYNTDKHNGVLFTDKKDTDKIYDKAVKYFHDKNNPKHYLIVASHNEKSIQMLDHYKNNNISVAHLLGFSDNLSNKLVTKNYKVYKYLPFGNYRDTFPYLLRRLYENYPLLIHLHN